MFIPAGKREQARGSMADKTTFLHCTFPFAAVALLLFAACGPAPADTEPAESKAPAATTRPQPTPPNSGSQTTAIPDDVSYTIIATDLVPGKKRALDVRLSKKVSEEVLAAIAAQLKNEEAAPYERTFIGYYLPDMQIDAGYWATTHFTPDLEVRILGLTLEAEHALKQPGPASRETIGGWLDERPFGAGRLTIYREGGKLYLETTYRDGSVGTAEVVETPSKRGRRFDYKPDRGNGEYFVINSAGELEQLDEEGVFMTARKIG